MRRHGYKKIQTMLLVSAAASLLLIVILAGDGFTKNVRNTIRGNDPLLQAMITKEDTGPVWDNSIPEDDKSLYALNNAGTVKILMLEVHSKSDMTLNDFEKTDTAENLSLPVIFKEPAFGGFGSSAVDVNGTVEIKGSAKENRKYHNFKLRLRDSAGRYNGQSILNLKKAYGKPCRVEEKFAFDLFAGLDHMMSLRTQFAELYVKNAASPDPEYESYGLYTLVEQPDENYFLNRSLDASANLYKARSFDFVENDALVDVNHKDYSKKDFEKLLDIRQGESHTSLLNMLEDVNDMSLDIDTVIQTHFNRENLLTYLAMNVILGNEDMSKSGYLLYKPVTSRVWYIFPENMSETMTSALDSDRYKIMNTGISQFSGNLLYERFLEKPENLKALTLKISQLMERIGPGTVKALTDQYIPVLKDYLTVNPDRGMLKNKPDKVIAGVLNYYATMEKNAAAFTENLRNPEHVVLLRPSKKDGRITLRWKPRSSLLSPAVTYTVEVASDPEFHNILLTRSRISETKYLLPEDIHPGRTAYFRVTAVSSDGKTAGSTSMLSKEDGSIIYGAAAVTLVGHDYPAA